MKIQKSFLLDVHADDIDTDHFAINLPVGDDRTEEVLKSGSWLGTPSAYQQTRAVHGTTESWHFMVLSWNPCIILTILCNQVCQHLFRYFSNHGHVLPAPDDTTHLITGHTKPVPTATLISALCDAGVHFICVINFRMKQAIDILHYQETFSNVMLSIMATRKTSTTFQYPITPFIYLIKAVPPYPPNVTVNQFAILTPLTINRQRSLCGNITIVVKLRKSSA
jgi:hypothetical protein